MIDLLLEHKTNKALVSIERKDIDSNKIQAFILGVSKKLVLIKYIYDFHIDGMTILRMSDISDIKCSKTDKFQLDMLKDEKLFDKIDFNVSYDITNWKTALSNLTKDFEYFILEDETESIFLIGKIDNITTRSVHINYFSGAGNWDKKPTIIKYSDITSCQIDTNYINFYERYFKRNS